MIRLLLGISCGLLISADAEAQIFRRPAAQAVPYYQPAPQQAPVVSTPAAADPAPLAAQPIVIAPPPTGTSCCSGSTPTAGCPGGCTYPPDIKQLAACKTIEFPPVSIDTKFTDKGKVICEKIDFYGPGEKFEAKVLVPETREQCKDVWEFKTLTLDIYCCEVKVCVPCQSKCVKTQVCTPVEKKVNLVAYMREDKTIDVYVEDAIPGMPTKYIQYLGLTAAALPTTFPGVTITVPKPPTPKPCP